MSESIRLVNIPFGVDPGLFAQAQRANEDYGNEGTQNTLEKTEYFRYLDSFCHLNTQQKNQAWDRFTSRLMSRENFYFNQVANLIGYTAGTVLQLSATSNINSAQKIGYGLAATAVVAALSCLNHYSVTYDLPMAQSTHAASLGVLFLGNAVTNILGTYVANRFFNYIDPQPLKTYPDAPWNDPWIQPYIKIELTSMGSFFIGNISECFGLGALHLSLRYLLNPVRYFT